MKAFIASLVVLMVVSVGSYIVLDQQKMSSSDIYSSNSVRLN